MNTPTPPPPPDPVATANAQANANVKAATTQQQVNMVDQDTPYGRLNYTQQGTWADGTPHFASTTKLSPEQQRNLDQQSEFDNLVNTLGINQTKKLTGYLDTPFKLGNEATESRLMTLGRARLDPMFAQRRDALESKLRNQGLAPGMEAYDKAMTENGQQENDAYNQLLLTGRGQANTELTAERNQPINEITALLNGGQVTQPTFTNTPNASVGSPDVGGMAYKAYEMGPLAKYNAENANRNAMMGGLFGLGGAALGGWAKGGFAKPGFMT